MNFHETSNAITSTPEVHLAQYHLVQKDHLAQHFFEQNFITLKYT